MGMEQSDSDKATCQTCGGALTHIATAYSGTRGAITLPAGMVIDPKALQMGEGKKIFRCPNCQPERWAHAL